MGLGLLRDCLGKSKVVAGGILEADFAHAVERRAFKLRDSCVFQDGLYGFEIVNLDVEEGRALLRGFDDQRHVIAEAGEGLVHDFGLAVLEGDETEFVAVRDFDGLGETETIDPEREDGSIALTKRTGVMRLTFMVLCSCEERILLRQVVVLFRLVEG